MTVYATNAQVAAKWRPLSTAEQATADVHLEEGSALLRRKVASLDAGIAAGTVDPILVRKVLTDAVIRMMINPSGASAQAVGPESVTFGGIRTLGVVAFTDAELAMVTPTSDGASAGGDAIGSARLGTPGWLQAARYVAGADRVFVPPAEPQPAIGVYGSDLGPYPSYLGPA